MNLGDHDLAEIIETLRRSPALRAKRDVQPIARALGGCAGVIRNGDDAAALPDADGYTLLAAEGMLPGFVQADPFFAGFCAVMTNVNDIAAMGGRPQAIVDVLLAGPDEHHTRAVLQGLAAGARTFGVPIVGGHTGRSEGPAQLSAAILGRARRLLTSFDARPGDRLLACVDLRGNFRGDTAHFDAVSGADPARLRAQLSLLPELAEAGWVHAGKDISNAGVLGTLLMLLETSGCGCVLDLAALPAPEAAQAQPLRWLVSFPSFGYLLAAHPQHAQAVAARFEAHGVRAAQVGAFCRGRALDVHYADDSVRVWDLAQRALLGFDPMADKTPS